MRLDIAAPESVISPSMDDGMIITFVITLVIIAIIAAILIIKNVRDNKNVEVPVDKNSDI